jgi:hypothetical protein
MANRERGSASHWPGVVIFNDQHVSVDVKQLAQLASPLFVECGAGGILRARGEKASRNPTFQGPRESLREEAKVIDAHWLKRQAEGSAQIKNLIVPGILNRDAVCRMQVSLEDALDRVKGSSHNGE